MKRTVTVLMLVFFSAIFVWRCKTDEPDPGSGFSLVSLKSGTTDLLSLRVGSDSLIENVSTTLNIVAEFSSDVDFASVSDTSIFLHRDSTKVAFNYVVQGRTITLDPVSDLLSGTNLTIEFSSKLKSVNGTHFTNEAIRLRTEGLGVDTPPQKDKQLIYLQFNGKIDDVTRHAITKTATLAYTVDRFGIANSAGNFRQAVTAGAGDIAELAGKNLFSDAMTISVWINVAQLTYRNLPLATYGLLGLGAESGYYMDLSADATAGSNSIGWATNNIVNPPINGSGTALFTDRHFGTTEANATQALLKDGWHHVVMTYDPTTSVKTFYSDGVVRAQWTLNSEAGSTVQGIKLSTTDTTKLAVGYYCSKDYTLSPRFNYQTALNTFVGAVDDLRIFGVALTNEEVVALYMMEKPLD